MCSIQEQAERVVEVPQLLPGARKLEPLGCQPCPLCRHWHQPPYDQQNPHTSHLVCTWGKSKFKAKCSILQISNSCIVVDQDKQRQLCTETFCSQIVSGSLTYFVFEATSHPLVGCSGGVYCLVGSLSLSIRFVIEILQGLLYGR